MPHCLCIRQRWKEHLDSHRLSHGRQPSGTPRLGQCVSGRRVNFRVTAHRTQRMNTRAHSRGAHSMAAALESGNDVGGGDTCARRHNLRSGPASSVRCSSARCTSRRPAALRTGQSAGNGRHSRHNGSERPTRRATGKACRKDVRPAKRVPGRSMSPTTTSAHLERARGPSTGGVPRGSPLPGSALFSASGGSLWPLSTARAK